MLKCGLDTIQSGLYLIPPNVFSILTSPIVLLAWLLTFFNSSRFSGIACLRVVLRSGSAVEERQRVLAVLDAKSLGFH